MIPSTRRSRRRPVSSLPASAIYFATDRLHPSRRYSEPIARSALIAIVFIIGSMMAVSQQAEANIQQEAASASAPVETLYLRDVKPVIVERCLACHGALKEEAGLRLDTADGMLDAGVVMAGDASASALLDRVTAEEEGYRMPPEGNPLTDAQIAAIQEWIDRGAVAPVDELPEPDPLAHWSFLPPEKERLPFLSPHDVPNPSKDMKSGLNRSEAGALTTRPRHPIDSMLELTRRDRGVAALPLASREQSIRRLYLDLIGLPPTPAEVTAYLNDSRDDAWERVVDRLLASPQYGERWGRHWMDIWRYSDWYGLGEQLRNSQKHLWHWRDWIVESLNDDVGYDRMVQLMLAADEIDPNHVDTLRATGFLARNYYLFNRTTWLDDTIEHTSKAFLGLTFNCAKCHDHKYDPISQVDYYRLRAIFEPHHVRLDPVQGVSGFDLDGIPRVYDQHLDRPTFVHIRGEASQPDESKEIMPGMPRFLGGSTFESAWIELPLKSSKPALREYAIRDRLDKFARDVAAAEQRLKEATTRWELLAQKTPMEASLAGRLLFGTDFASADASHWKSTGGSWEFTKEGVVQHEVGAESRSLRFQEGIPTNFVAKLDFTTLGGQQWKSVGLAFDVGPNEAGVEQRVLVYMSAVEGGSKLQVSFGPTSGPVYPADGRVEMPVQIDQPYSLEIAVRDRRLNIRVNDQLRLSYDLPNDRQSGELELVTFDAKARFSRFELHELSEEATLEAPGQPMLTVAQAEAAARLAKTDVVVVKSEREAWQAASRAELGKAEAKLPSDQIDELARAATAAFHRFQRSQQERELANLHWQVTQASDDAERDKLQLRYRELEMQLAEAASDSDDDTVEYLTIRGGEKALEGPDETQESRAKVFPEHSTGRRKALAEWLTAEENPLTARVAVNHIWTRHFGQPLVESVSDFGRRCPKPEQQRLLDWLACELVEHDWSMKHIHRLIVTSAAYRLSSQQQLADAATQRADPTNQTFWRRRPIRMESEVVRDSLWHLAGLLDVRFGGPSLAIEETRPPYRRSLYFLHSRDEQQRFLAMFDNADILRCYRREESVIPQQALALSNSREAIEAAREIAQRFETSPTEDAFLNDAFQYVLGVAPDDAELRACREGYQRFLELAEETDNASAASRARTMLVLSLLNCNDFITIR